MASVARVTLDHRLRQRVEIGFAQHLLGINGPREVEELADRGVDVADVLGDARFQIGCTAVIEHFQRETDA